MLLEPADNSRYLFLLQQVMAKESEFRLFPTWAQLKRLREMRDELTLFEDMLCEAHDREVEVAAIEREMKAERRAEAKQAKAEADQLQRLTREIEKRIKLGVPFDAEKLVEEVMSRD